MTTIALHSAPRWRTIAREQVRATRLAVQRDVFLFVASVAGFFALIVEEGFRRHVPVLFGYVAGMAALSGLVALVLPLIVWRSDEIERRSYHWAMPTSRVGHSAAKSLAGLVWVFVLVALYLALIAVTSKITMTIPSFLISPQLRPPRPKIWEWAAAFTLATVLYFFGSAAVLGSKYPGRWIVLVPGLYCVGWALALEGDQLWLKDAFQQVWSGRFGLVRLLSGPGDKWFQATLVWTGIAITTYLIALVRYRDA